MTTPSSNTHSNVQGSFGAMLQQARKAKQVSLDDVANELFILKRHLQALENEDFSDLPQVAFARGFAINYAKYLGLDTVRIDCSFDAAFQNELKSRSAINTQSPLQPMGTLQRDTHNRIRFNPLLIIAVIGVIILAIFLFRMVSNASKENIEQPISSAEDISAVEQAQGAAINTDVTGVSASGSALNLGDDVAPATLDVKLTDAAVVTITDATGSSLIAGSQNAGDYQLSGMPPFDVQIDNINNVRLMLNQQSVALNSYANGNQASFELAP